MTRRPRAPLSQLSALPALATALALSACGGGGDDGGGGSAPPPGPDLLQVAAGPATIGFTPIAASGSLVVYLADEATSGPEGTDFNGNGVLTDAIPVVIDTVTQTESNLLVAGSQCVWSGQHLYYVVDEIIDGREWLGAGMDDLVLLHWTPGSPNTALATLDRRGARQVVSDGANVFFVRDLAAPGPNETSLGMIGPAAPLTVIPVGSNVSTGGLRPTIMGIDEGLLSLALDETLATADYNGDMDAMDPNVLALLDGTGAVTGGVYGPVVRSTGRATFSPSTPVRAKRDAAGTADWLVGFLVDEADQGMTNFNTFQHPDIPASWVPTQCGTTDVDTEDEVLHFLEYAAWVQDPVNNPPRNTGLVGKHRVVIVDEFVGTVSQESELDQGFGEPCDLNGDGDRLDDIFRWVRAATPILPPGEISQLFPPGNVPGGTFGIAELGSRWLIAVSEAQDASDLNGDGAMDLDIVGWFEPATSELWTFDSGSAQGSSFAAATWMGELPGRERVGVAFSELANGVDLNEDGDAVDSVATFAFYDADAGRLAFPGFAVATQANNAGTVVQNGQGFYRVSEIEDGIDLNGDGSADDYLLWRSRLEDGTTVSMFSMNDAMRRAVDPDDPAAGAGAFVVDESGAGDVNEDGRTGGFTLVYFAWP